MENRSTLFALLFIAALAGGFGGHSMARHASGSLISKYALELLFSFATFVWYCRDGDARGFIRSRWLSMAMVTVPMLAIPRYLWRSRPAGKRGKAILRFLGFAMLLLCAGVVGMVVGKLLA